MAQTKFSEPAELEADFIVYICKKVRGIGERTAQAVAEHFENAEMFARSTESELLEWTNHSKKPILKPQQAKEVIALRDQFMSRDSSDIRQLWITALIRDFVANALREINETDVKKLRLNPFLVRAFNFKDHKEVIRFCFYQKVSTAITDSWAFIVDELRDVKGKEFIKRDLDDFVSLRGGNAAEVLQWAINGMPDNQDFGSVIEAKEKHLVREWEDTFGSGIRSILKALERPR